MTNQISHAKRRFRLLDSGVQRAAKKGLMMHRRMMVLSLALAIAAPLGIGQAVAGPRPPAADTPVADFSSGHCRGGGCDDITIPDITGKCLAWINGGHPKTTLYTSDDAAFDTVCGRLYREHRLK